MCQAVIEKLPEQDTTNAAIRDVYRQRMTRRQARVEAVRAESPNFTGFSSIKCRPGWL